MHRPISLVPRGARVAGALVALALAQASAADVGRASAGASVESSVEVSAQASAEVSAGSLRLERATSARGTGSEASASTDSIELDARDAIALDATLELDARGLLAELRLVQAFRNDTTDWRDGRYAFPMPDGATLLGLEIRVGERTIRGAVAERAAADRTYAAAAAAGRVAAVVDVHRPNLFETRVASIGPGEEVRVTLDVLLPVRSVDGRRELVLPTTLTPRYADADVPDAGALDSPVLPAALVRGPRVALRMRAAGREPSSVASPTHRPSVDGDVVRLEAPADRDVVLRWPGNAGAEPAGEVHVARHAGHRYAQLLLEPPASDASDAATEPASRPRELVLVLDRSGSMGGEPIRAAKAAAQAALDRLGPADAFNVIAFDDGPSWAFDASRPATPEAVAAARRFVAALIADGGTEIRPALERALASSARGADAGRLVQVVFVTDGAVGHEDALLADIERGLGARRLFTVGIGSAPNRWFLERAATLGRGTATFVADAQGVEAGIGALLETLAVPVLTDLVASPTTGTMMLFPDPLPDLYAGRPVMLVARLDADVDEIVVTGRHRGTRWRRAFAVPPVEGVDEPMNADPVNDGPANGERAPVLAPVPAVASRWAAARVDDLLDAQRTAADPDVNRDEIVAVALEAGLATRYTSFVAVADEITRPASVAARTTDVANLMPAGTVMVPVAMPRGALGLPAARRLALLLACAALALLAAGAALRRGRPDRAGDGRAGA